MRKPRETDPRKIPRQARARATVDAIADAATRILEEAGTSDINVNDVAKRAGVSIGSLYQYFPSKTALLGEVARRFAGRWTDDLSVDIGEVAMKPVEEAVREMIRRQVQTTSRAPRLVRALKEDPVVAETLKTPAFDDLFAEAVAAYLEFHRPRVRVKNVRLAVKIVNVAIEAVGLELLSVELDEAIRREMEDEICDLVIRYWVE